MNPRFDAHGKITVEQATEGFTNEPQPGYVDVTVPRGNSSAILTLTRAV